MPFMIQGKNLDPGFKSTKMVEAKMPNSHKMSVVPQSDHKTALEYDRVFGKMAPKKLYSMIDGINSSLAERKTVIQKKAIRA